MTQQWKPQLSYIATTLQMSTQFCYRRFCFTTLSARKHFQLA